MASLKDAAERQAFSLAIDATLKSLNKDREKVECNMHYPVPCHLQKAYANLGYKPGDCPNAEYLAAHCVTLPLFPEMREDEIRRVIELCNAYRQ